MHPNRRRLLLLLAGSGIGSLAGCNSLQSKDAETEKLVPDDGDPRDSFGGAVALSGDGGVALVGAPGAENPDGERVGAAYVFERANGTWTRQAKIAAGDGRPRDDFGQVVALADDGSVVLVGAPARQRSDGPGDAGAAYVFERADGDWRQRAKLAPEDGDPSDGFGGTVALSGDGSVALAGAPTAEGRAENPKTPGSTYVFERADGGWRRQAELAAGDDDPEDLFGGAVALADDGRTALVGAPWDAEPNGERAGSVYAFERSDGTWSRQAKFAAEDGDPGDQFGTVTLADDGSVALVGVPTDDGPNGEQSGAAYAFERAGGNWNQRAKLTAGDGTAEDFFGSVALTGDGSTALVGAPYQDDPNGEQAGAAYVFDRAGGDWRQRTKLAAEDGDVRDTFGGTVALADDGSTALVGASGDEDPNGQGAGSVYVFEWSGG